TELGKKAEPLMREGRLVPDDLVIGLIEERLRAGDVGEGALFDGFPRTLPQAQALEEALARMGLQIDKVISLEVPEEILVERLEVFRTEIPKVKEHYRKLGKLVEIDGVGSPDEVYARIRAALES